MVEPATQDEDMSIFSSNLIDLTTPDLLGDEHYTLEHTMGYELTDELTVNDMAQMIPSTRRSSTST